MSTWLVTGGAGFIGSNFARMAAATSDTNIVVLDALTYAGNLENIDDLLKDGSIQFVHGDICDEDLLSSLFKEHAFDAVVHFAAESHVDRSILGAHAFLRTNIDGTFTLLEAARQAWASDYEKHIFLHVSTDEVYGDLELDEPAFTEQTPYHPNSPYASSKAASDHLARAWHRTYGLPVIVTNCSNNYGPWQFPEKLIPLMIFNALEERELPVYGDGQQIRDWLHVTDHCEALLAVLQNGRVGETYNIGGDNERTNLDIVQLVCKSVDEMLGRATGTSSQLIRYVQDRPGHDRRYAVDASKIKTELGWAPRKHFPDALRETVRWNLDHQDWAERIRSGEYLEFYQRQYGNS